MADVTIKNVPAGAEEEVKRLAMVAIERFERKATQVIPEETKEAHEDKIDSILVANGLEKKFEKVEVVEEPVVIEK